jgi:ribulose-phosphate 3-epimerase
MDKLDVILLMSVNPGFGGQSFIPQTLDKLREVRRRIDESGYDIRLEVDGGVKVSNIAEIAAAVRICLLPVRRFSISRTTKK